MSGISQRQTLLKRALWLEGFTIGYNVLEGVIAIVAGWLASSVALVGFGLDSIIETSSAIVVFVRLLEEFRGHDADTHVMTERRAEQFVAVTLFALCIFVIYESITALATHDVPSESPIGIVLAALSLTLMPFLALAKHRTGRALESRALLADSKETLICSYLSFSLLLGLSLNAAFGWWWADPVAALLMVPFIFGEAREAWEG